VVSENSFRGFSRPHIRLRPATSESFHNLLTHIIQAERDNLELICEIIDKENMDVDLWPEVALLKVRTFQVLERSLLKR
jgi:hypothetical protein